jgi:uncharacterized protein YecE (DUF72 family)
MGARYFIGTSGWHYPHWRGAFYPADLPAQDWLAFYAREFNAVEVNASFYRLPTLATVRAWRAAVPVSFRFALKASRYITHLKKLTAPRRSCAAFFKVARAFGTQCGPILFQLPPRWRCDPVRLERFLRALPGEFEYAFEFRDRSWHRREVYALLRAHRTAFCVYDLAGFTAPFERTADFAYLRLHGPAFAYAGCYTPAALQDWAIRLTQAHRKRGYVFFDNDESAYAVCNARDLHALLATA